jgi:hypothetical protein
MNSHVHGISRQTNETYSPSSKVRYHIGFVPPSFVLACSVKPTSRVILQTRRDDDRLVQNEHQYVEPFRFLGRFPHVFGIEVIQQSFAPLESTQSQHTLHILVSFSLGFAVEPLLPDGLPHGRCHDPYVRRYVRGIRDEPNYKRVYVVINVYLIRHSQGLNTFAIRCYLFMSKLPSLGSKSVLILIKPNSI